MQFKNRIQAGKLLAEKLTKLKLNFNKKSTIVIALPRGGVPVGNQIAMALDLPLDILLIKKIGSPSYPELAIGTVSENNEEIFNHDLVKELGLKRSELDPIKERALIKLQEIAHTLRNDHLPTKLQGKDIILVDDGIDSGATIKAAILILKQRNVKKIIVAVPVTSSGVVLEIKKLADQLCFLESHEPIYTIGEWYEDFLQVDSEEVQKILSQHGFKKPKHQEVGIL